MLNKMFNELVEGWFLLGEKVWIRFKTFQTKGIGETYMNKEL